MKSQLPALKAELAGLNARIAEAREAEMPAAIAVCREIVELFGLTAYDLGLVPTQVIPAPKRVSATFKPQAPRLVHPPVFRNPATGETWNGRGRPPVWMK